AGGGAACLSSRATWPSSSAIRAAAVFAARPTSLLLVRSVALARSSCSTRVRNSSLLSLGAAGEAAPACSGAAVVLVTLAEVFAVAAAGRPGLRVGAAGFLVCVALAGRAMSRLLPSLAERDLSAGPPRHILACKRQPARASFTCFAGLKPSFLDAAISIV